MSEKLSVDQIRQAKKKGIELYCYNKRSRSRFRRSTKYWCISTDYHYSFKEAKQYKIDLIKEKIKANQRIIEDYKKLISEIENTNDFYDEDTRSTKEFKDGE